MEYFLQENPNSDTLIVLFHGTGGNQYQLLPFSGELFPEANVLSMQGRVGEGKERRFFAPLNHNELDRNDFNKQTGAFVEFWNSFIKAYTFKNVIFLGYSNGANFILGTLEHDIVNIDHILLLHPSNLAYNITKSYQDTSLIITTGSNDYLTVPGKVKALSEALQPQFKHVQFKLLDGGHELDETEIKLLKTIL
ncbi:alpha/beta hydrolase [Mammaliicoccus vitulinus]|uniref:alpha/beta hydrolase n=1 Tax=Mammaliicoccus vitulinus TaxID=71237 RepID=UPI003B9F90FB